MLKKRLYMYVALLVVVVGAAVGITKYQQYQTAQMAQKIAQQQQSQTAQATQQEKAARLNPVFSVLSNTGVDVYVRNTVTSQTSLLVSLPISDIAQKTRQSNYSAASYSTAKNQIAFTDAGSLNIYDVTTKKTSGLYKEAAGINVTLADPQWSPSGRFVEFKRLFYEGSETDFFDTQENQLSSTKINGSSITSWTGSGDQLVAAGIGNMGITYGLEVSDAQLTNLHAVLDQKNIITGSTNWYNNKQVVFSFYPDKSSENGFDGGLPIQQLGLYALGQSDYTTIVSDEFNNQYPIVDGNSVYFSKSNSQKSNGLYQLNVATQKASPWLDYQNQYLQPLLTSQKYLVINGEQQDPNRYLDSRVSTLLLVDKTNKQVVQLGTGSTIQALGWIKTQDIPTDAQKNDPPTASKAEHDAAALALKSKGYLQNTYYNYCWDFNCASSTKPYPPLTTSGKEDVITVDRTIPKLTGNVVVPVVYATIGNEIWPQYAVDILSDQNQVNSYPYVANWINKQAQQNKQKLNLSFSIQTNSVSIPETCVNKPLPAAVGGIVDYVYDTSCIKDTILQTYPTLSNSKNLFVVIAAQLINGQDLMLNNTLVQEDGSSDYFILPQRGIFSGVPQRLEDKMKLGLYMTAGNVLSMFGAQSKAAEYERQSTNCLIANLKDPMCAYSLQDAEMPDTGNLVMDPITIKEMGWYDPNDSGINVVDSLCPFALNSTCKK